MKENLSGVWRIVVYSGSALIVLVCIAFAVPGGPTAFWAWFGPGINAVKNAAPIGSFLAVLLASIAALLTLSQRSKIDEAEQWWKRAEFGIELIHRGAEQRATGTRILESLVRMKPPADATTEQIAEHINSERLRKLYGWQVSEVDQKMLDDIAEKSLKGPIPESLSKDDLANSKSWTLNRLFHRGGSGTYRNKN